MEQITEIQEETYEITQASSQPAAELEQASAKSKKPKKKKKHTKLIVWSIVILVVVGYIGYSVYAAANYIPTVKAGDVSYQQIDTYLSTTATIASPDTISYFAPPKSLVTEVNVKAGDTVKKGDVIAAFDLSDLNDEVRLAQLNLSDANIALTKAKDDASRQITVDELNAQIADCQSSINALQSKITKYERDELDSGSPTDLEAWQRRIQNLTAEINDLQGQKGDYPQAKATELDVKSRQNAAEKAAINLRALQKYQDDKGIIAEADGIVTQINLVKGSPASNTSVACVIDSTSELKAKFNIGKYDLSSIEVGQTVKLSLGSLAYEGTVTKIGSAAVKTANSSGTTTTATIPAEITVTNPDANLVVGLDFDAEIHTFSNPQALSVPVEAILTDRGGDFCYKLIPGEKPGIYTYEKTYITTGNSSESYIEVFSGITEGDRVILTPPTTIEMLPLVRVDEAAAAVSDSSAAVPAA